MTKPYTPKERTSPAIRDGFDSDPQEREVGASDLLLVYRAHGGASRMIGRFFFTPQVAGLPRVNWTAEFLEKELNAALWGNEFRFLAKFRVFQGVRYKIGPIAHDKYQGVERATDGTEVIDVPFDQYSYFRNANLFYQVQIDMVGDWRRYLELLEDTPIKPGNFVSRPGRC
jgi:hypothetical protein